MNKILRFSAAVCASLAIIYPVLLVAQEGSSATQSRSLLLEEVVVTARKREELLQDTPISINAMSSAELERRQITSLDDLQNSVANLTIETNTGSNAAIYIRGVGQKDGGVTFDSGVGLYIDGVYRARVQGGALGLLDIERVEVLRGPQGTLYGRNTIGGAINLISSKPDPEGGGKVKASAGNLGYKALSFTADAALSDQLTGRIALGYEGRDGYNKNITTGDYWDDNDFKGARIVLDYQASESLNLLLSADWSERKQESTGGKCMILDPSNPILKYYLPSVANACQDSFELDKSHFAADNESKNDYEEKGVSFTANWDLNDNLTLKSLTSLRRLEWQTYTDVDGTGSPVVTSNHLPSEQKQLSQEFQLSGMSLDDRMQWTAGLYYFEEQSDRPAESALPFFGRFSQRIRETDNSSWAIFSQGTYQINSQLDLTLGLRHTREQRQFTNLDQSDRFDPATIEIFKSPEEDFSATTGLINLAYHPRDNLLIYGSFSQGYKAGGYNPRPDINLPGTLQAFDEETLDAFEIGIKTSWLDERVTANVAIFHSDYEDLQLNIMSSIPDGGGVPIFENVVRNAAEANIDGVEVELTIFPSDQLRITAGYGYTDASYDDFTLLAGDPLAPTEVDASDREFVNTPESTFNLAVDYSIGSPMTGLALVNLHIDYFNSDPVWRNVENKSPQYRTGRYSLINASAHFEFSDNKTWVKLWAKNLENSRYMKSAADLDFLGTGLLFHNEPRTYGVTVGYNY
jgi:iron complex outermembrane receptor protein